MALFPCIIGGSGGGPAVLEKLWYGAKNQAVHQTIAISKKYCRIIVGTSDVRKGSTYYSLNGVEIDKDNIATMIYPETMPAQGATVAVGAFYFDVDINPGDTFELWSQRGGTTTFSIFGELVE